MVTVSTATRLSPICGCAKSMAFTLGVRPLIVRRHTMKLASCGRTSRKRRIHGKGWYSMDAEKVVRELGRMCCSMENCADCKVSKLRDEEPYFCMHYVYKYPAETIRIVEEWSKAPKGEV